MSRKRIYNEPYTFHEEKTILHYIVENHLVCRVKGDQIWKQMANERIIERSWGSMKQHFRKAMIFKLYRYDLPEHQIEAINRQFRVVCTKKSPKSGQKLPKFTTHWSSSDSDSENSARFALDDGVEQSTASPLNGLRPTASTSNCKEVQLVPENGGPQHKLQDSEMSEAEIDEEDLLPLEVIEIN